MLIWSQHFDSFTFTETFLDAESMTGRTEGHWPTIKRAIIVDTKSWTRAVVQFLNAFVDILSGNDLHFKINNLPKILFHFNIPSHRPVVVLRRNPSRHGVKGLHRYDPAVLTQSAFAGSHLCVPSSHSLISSLKMKLASSQLMADEIFYNSIIHTFATASVGISSEPWRTSPWRVMMMTMCSCGRRRSRRGGSCRNGLRWQRSCDCRRGCGWWRRCRRNGGWGS